MYLNDPDLPSFNFSNRQTPDVPSTIEGGAEYKIPIEGSLGLLALGAVGIQAWRQVRDGFLSLNKHSQEFEGDDDA